MKSASSSIPADRPPAAPAPLAVQQNGEAMTPGSSAALGRAARAHGTRPGGARRPSRSRAVRFESGQTVFAPGSGGGVIYIVRAGCIRLYKTLPDGRSINLGLLGPNTVFTQEDAPGGLASGTTAEALRESTLLVVEAGDLAAVIAESPELAAPMVRGMTRRLTELQMLVEHLLARDLSVRLAATLLALADAFGEPMGDGLTKIALPVSRQGLANMIGANRVTVTRALVALERSGVARTLSRATIAVDGDGLRRYARRPACPDKRETA